MNEETEIDETDYKCECCGDSVDGSIHACPYAEDIHGFDKECNCCEGCTYQCLMDI